MLIKNLYNIKISLMLGEGCKTGTCAYLPPIYDVITQEKQTGIQRLCKWEHLKNAYELINLAALKISTLYKNASFIIWVRYLVWNFKGTLTHTLKDAYFIRR